MADFGRLKSIMNRFLNKKKGGDDAMSPPQSGKKWRKGKKAPMEQRPELDLTAALPSTDDFRTSLIMPTLSTRFSMLREQDDPNTKMGKASDDSVLQPQRSSRLLDFGFNSSTLNDIAEVASINSSIRPPFAARSREESYGSEEGYGTDTDSMHNANMMSRARPGEGNILFGGRQKVYKIPTGSARSIGGGSERNMGKVVYDDDVNMSAFQRYRQHQQRAAAAEAAMAAEEGEDIVEQEATGRQSLDDSELSARDSGEPTRGIGLGLSHPDTTSQSFKRSSDSTTTSGPSQGGTSTAATSVASQSIGTAVTSPSAQPAPTSTTPAPALERSLTKRRLYEQGLEKNMYEQQASTMTRLNSIQRHRSPTVGSAMSPPALSHSRSNGHLQERGFQPYALQTSAQPATNAFSPLAMRMAGSNSSSPVASHPQSPLSPNMSDSEDYKTLHSALEPGDRGKATAMGAFNKPKQQYDEEQYMQRQVQLQSSQHSGSRQNSIDLTKRSESRLARFDSARQPDDSRARSRSISTSSRAEQNASQAFAVFQNAAVQNRVVHGENPNLPPSAPLPPPPTMVDTHRTFFGDISASDDEEEEETISDFDRSGSHYVSNSYMATSSNGRFTPTSLASVSEHPALRHDTPNLPEVNEEDEEEEKEEEEEAILPTRPLVITSPERRNKIASNDLPRSSSEYKEDDSPTIGSKDGLGGLIHHLRNTSDQSSIYPVSTNNGGTAGVNHETSNYSGNGAWDLDELENYYGTATGTRPSSRRDSVPARGQPLAPAPSKANIYPTRPSTRDSDVIDGISWQNDFKKQHTRDASTATQAERQAFDDELAARQKAIQEKMKSIVESESRATSPAPTAGGALKAFGMLKTKPSQEAMSRDTSSKAMKMLGLSGQTGQDKSSMYEDPQANNSGISHANTWAPTMNPQWPLGGPKEQRSVTSLPGQRSPPQPASSTDGFRPRSNSAASRTRSRSRAGTYRDDFDAPEMPQLPASRPSMETMHAVTPPLADVQARGRLRSNSKQSAYFEHKGLHPAHGGTPTGGMTPGGVSPASTSSATYTSSTSSTPRPSYSTATSSHGSKAGSPAMGVPHVSAVRPAGGLLRKKTINKADIGEPTLISSTSNVDTVDLPTARTLVQPPLIPPLNPRRRIFTHGDATASAEISRAAFSPPPIQHAATFSGRPGPRAVRSAESMVDSQPARFDAIGSPVMNEAGMF